MTIAMTICLCNVIVCVCVCAYVCVYLVGDNYFPCNRVFVEDIWGTHRLLWFWTRIWGSVLCTVFVKLTRDRGWSNGHYTEKAQMQIPFRPHRSTTYVDAAYCYRPSSVVCRSVCLSVCLSVRQSVGLFVTLVSPAKTADRSRCRSSWGLGWAQGTMY